MYRAVTLFAMRHNLIANGQVDAAKLQEEMGNIHISLRLNPETQRPDTYLNGECVEREIRTMEVSRHVSLIAALPFVRSAMVEMQREMVCVLSSTMASSACLSGLVSRVESMWSLSFTFSSISS